MPTYILGNPEGHTITISSPTPLTKLELAAKVKSQAPASSPNAQEAPLSQRIVSHTGPALRYGGTALGGALTSELGPLAMAGGGALGWQAGDTLQRSLEDLTGITHNTPKENLKTTAKNALLQAPVEGMLNAFGGPMKKPGAPEPTPTSGIKNMRKALGIKDSQMATVGTNKAAFEKRIANRAIEMGQEVSEKGHEAVKGRLKDSYNKMETLVAAHPNATVDPMEVAAHMDKVIERASKSRSPGSADYIAKLQEGKAKFLEQFGSKSGKFHRLMTLREAQDAKIAAYAETATRFSKNAGDFSVAEMEIHHAMERGLKDEINKIIPAMKDVNQGYKYDAIIDQAVDTALKRMGKDKWTLFEALIIPITLMSAGGGAMMGGGMGHEVVGGAVGGLAGIGGLAAKKLLNSPKFQSYLALGLRDAAKGFKAGVKVTGGPTPKGTAIQVAGDNTLEALKALIDKHSQAQDDKPWKEIGQ